MLQSEEEEEEEEGCTGDERGDRLEAGPVGSAGFQRRALG